MTLLLRLVLSLFCLLTMSCAPRGDFDLVPEAGGAALRTVFVASNRVSIEPVAFRETSERGEALRYGQLVMSIPPVHRRGGLEWPGQATPDPARHFVVQSAAELGDVAAFLAALEAAGGGRGVLIFVHGYNNNLAETVYRAAQIAHDFDLPVPMISFAWPSAGDVRGYAYDRDSVMHSRDALEQLLVSLTDGSPRKVSILAHSMGSQLVMETLRQMSIGGKSQALGQVSGVTLVSPDIDPEVFVRQASRITPFPQPFRLAVSTKDRILNFSAWLTGQPRRLGEITRRDDLGGLPVEIVDLTALTPGFAASHMTAFSVPSAIDLLRSLRVFAF